MSHHDDTDHQAGMTWAPVAGHAGVVGRGGGAAAPRSCAGRPATAQHRDHAAARLAPMPPNVYFRDPDVLSVDPGFDALAQGNAPIRRLWTGGLWLRASASSAVGQYLPFSDIPNNRQMRWLADGRQGPR